MSFRSQKCQGQVYLENGRCKVTGNCGVGQHRIRYLAAAPADLRQSYSGSGLPFPNEEVAYSNEQSGDLTTGIDGNFSFEVFCPNSYYKHGGSVLVEPHLHLVIDEQEHVDVQLSHTIPNRSLKNLEGRWNRSHGAGRATTGGWLGNH